MIINWSLWKNDCDSQKRRIYELLIHLQSYEIYVSSELKIDANGFYTLKVQYEENDEMKKGIISTHGIDNLVRVLSRYIRNTKMNLEEMEVV